MRIIVEISGGVLQAVYSDTNLKVDLLDYDNMKQCDDEERREELEYYQRLEEEKKSLRLMLTRIW
jgi:hypothetical protein